MKEIFFNQFFPLESLEKYRDIFFHICILDEKVKIDSITPTNKTSQEPPESALESQRERTEVQTHNISGT